MQKHIKYAESLKIEYLEKERVKLLNKKISFSTSEYHLLIKKQFGGFDRGDKIYIKYYVYYGKIPILIENNKNDPLWYTENYGWAAPSIKYYKCYQSLHISKCKGASSAQCEDHDEDEFYSQEMFDFLKMIQISSIEITPTKEVMNSIKYDFLIYMHE